MFDARQCIRSLLILFVSIVFIYSSIDALDDTTSPTDQLLLQPIIEDDKKTNHWSRPEMFKKDKQILLDDGEICSCTCERPITTTTIITTTKNRKETNKNGKNNNNSKRRKQLQQQQKNDLHKNKKIVKNITNETIQLQPIAAGQPNINVEQILRRYQMSVERTKKILQAKQKSDRHKDVKHLKTTLAPLTKNDTGSESSWYDPQQQQQLSSSTFTSKIPTSTESTTTTTTHAMSTSRAKFFEYILQFPLPREFPYHLSTTTTTTTPLSTTTIAPSQRSESTTTPSIIDITTSIIEFAIDSKPIVIKKPSIDTNNEVNVTQSLYKTPQKVEPIVVTPSTIAPESKSLLAANETSAWFVPPHAYVPSVETTKKTIQTKEMALVGQLEQRRGRWRKRMQTRMETDKAAKAKTKSNANKIDKVVKPQSRIVYRLSQQHCDQIDYYAQMFLVPDVRAWVRHNCLFARIYLPKASCEEIYSLVDSCFK